MQRGGCDNPCGESDLQWPAHLLLNVRACSLSDSDVHLHPGFSLCHNGCYPITNPILTSVCWKFVPYQFLSVCFSYLVVLYPKYYLKEFLKTEKCNTQKVVYCSPSSRFLPLMITSILFYFLFIFIPCNFFLYIDQSVCVVCVHWCVQIFQNLGKSEIWNLKFFWSQTFWLRGILHNATIEKKGKR